MITLTDEQRAAVQAVGNIFLSACPGSGKTRVITAKLLSLAEAQEGTTRSVACITYTNAAVDEIELRLKQAGNASILDRAEVSTIHSFCLQYILRPYRWLVPEVPQNFKILTREMPEFEELVTIAEDEIRRIPRFQTFEDYDSIDIDIGGEPFGEGLTSGAVTRDRAFRFWELMRARGYIDFSLILYYSYQILQANPFVAEGVSSRFQWMLVDEFQDTTEIQLAIFETLHDKGHSGFFLVGDENQSILGFAGARPEAAHRFADSVGASRDYSLSGNFRSGPHIVGMAERLIAREPAMHSVGDAATFNFPPQYVHVAQPVVAVTDYFLPWLEVQRIPFGKAAILAPWWRHLVPISRHLRELGVPVVGPGARPYQKRRLFVGLAEQLGACVEAEHFLNISGVEKAIFRLVQEALGETRFDVFSYEGRRTSLALIYEAKRIAGMGLGGVDWLKQCSDGSSDILISDGWISESQRGLLRASVDDMLADMERRDVDTENMQIADLGIFANPEKAIQLITFHLSKGREFDAAALVSVNEGKIPFFKATTQAEFDEARRLFYVGITRPKKLLLIASDQSHPRDRPSRYISECWTG